MHGHTAVVKLLLSADATQLLATDKDHNCPLSWAARYGHTQTVQQMLLCAHLPESPIRTFVRAGGEIASEDGRTALVWASQNGRSGVVKMLVDYSGFGSSAALSSAAQGGHVDCVRLLVAAHASVNELDADGWSVLMVAAADGHGQVCAELVQAGAHVCGMNEDGMTAADLAEREGHDHILPLLVEMVHLTTSIEVLPSKSPVKIPQFV